jgi:hypothetical protein
MDKRNERLIKVNNKYEKLLFSLYKTKLNKDEQLKDLNVSFPNITALILNISDKAFEKSKEIYNDILLPCIVDKGDYYIFDINNSGIDGSDKDFFDLFENIIISIVFAYTSVESLVNNLIPNNVLLVSNKDGKLNLLDKEFVEKKIQLSVKIKNILPKIYNFKFEANNISFWSDFKKLEKYRNGFIHPKSNEIEGKKSKQVLFLSHVFFDVCNHDIIESARAMIKYLFMKIKLVPGIPLEFIPDSISIDHYIDHYRNKKIDTNKEIRIEFKDSNALEKFKDELKLDNTGIIDITINP